MGGPPFSRSVERPVDSAFRAGASTTQLTASSITAVAAGDSEVLEVDNATVEGSSVVAISIEVDGDTATSSNIYGDFTIREGGGNLTSRTGFDCGNQPILFPVLMQVPSDGVLEFTVNNDTGASVDARAFVTVAEEAK